MTTIRTIYHINRWTVGQWQFFEIDEAQISESYAGRKLYGYTDNTVGASADGIHEWFNSLEHAMAAAIAEKHTGPRGAGGTGVGTAADWFMRMIGVGQLQEAGPDGGRVLMEAVRQHRTDALAAHNIQRDLEAHGYVIAREPID
jgi:hypothetical protein